MLRSEKISVARIFQDLIHADKIVDSGEMEFWRHVCEKYRIDREARVEACNISFADALRIIKDEGTLGSELLADCRAMTVSDGFCAFSEALLMVALSATLEKFPEGKDSDSYGVPSSGISRLYGEVLSLPRSDFDIDVATALYIENEFDPETNGIIERDYRSMYKELQLAGFHLVYIPKVIKHYRDTAPGHFKEILSFLAPALSGESIDATYSEIMQMTTASFCKDLLCNKLGITALRDTPPSLLIKIGHSNVGGESYANYLRLEVENEISSLVREFSDEITGMLSSDVVVVKTSEERGNQFHFHGFYKQLLNIFLVRKNIRSRVLINPYKEEIAFPDVDAKAQGLHRREKALYALLLCAGGSGVNFTPPASGAAYRHYTEKMRRLQARYSAIYGMFGGNPEAAPDLSVPEIRRPIISCLKRSIRGITGLYNPDDYNVVKGAGGNYSVHLEQSKVLVCGEPLPDSELFKRYQNP